MQNCVTERTDAAAGIRRLSGDITPRRPGTERTPSRAAMILEGAAAFAVTPGHKGVFRESLE
ncbi:MAG: hypothetical protein EA423_00295 [Phycisphaerales bacterium]|nr:MAG: hypothetical protein EA423_00295 [Phycisphaerales bacterium]